MAERDRLTQRDDARTGWRDDPERGRAGAFRGESAGQRGAGGGRSEFGGYGGAGAGGSSGYGGPGRAGGSGYGGGSSSSGAGGRGGWGGAGDPGAGGGARQGGSPWSSQPGGTDPRSYGGGRDESTWGDAPQRRGSQESWSERERWESGGGTGWTGPSGLGWQTDAGYGAGATGYGRTGSGALGESGGRWGGAGSGIGGGGGYGTGGAMGYGLGGTTGGTGPSRNRGPKGWQRSDERIHDDVCERLAHEPGVDPSEVEVEVRDGTVTLTGSVPDRGMKYRIEDIVDGCSGVRDVENRLRVTRGGSMAGGFLGGAASGLGTTTDARSRAGGRGPDAGASRGSLLGRLFGFSSGARLSDIMTRNPRTVSPDETLQKVAQAMKEQDVGAIPVCTGRTLTGMVTDRDIVVRAVAGGRGLEQTKVSDVMTTQVHSCYEDEDVESALDKMGDLQIRRIPVVDRSNQLVGIVSLGDFAQRETGDVEDALQDISKPS